MVYFQYHFPRLLRERKAYRHYSGFLFIHLDTLYTVKFFDERLCHRGFGGLGSELIDKLFRLLNHLFLVLLSGKLLGNHLFSQF